MRPWNAKAQPSLASHSASFVATSAFNRDVPDPARLERQPSRQLQDPSGERRYRSSKQWTGQVIVVFSGIQRVQVRIVEGVERLQPELHVGTIRARPSNPHSLDERQIHVEVAGTTETVAAEIAFRARRRRAEVGCLEDAFEEIVVGQTRERR